MTGFIKINSMGCSKGKSYQRAHRSLPVSIKNKITFHWRHLWENKCRFTYTRYPTSIPGFFIGSLSFIMVVKKKKSEKNTLGSHLLLQYHAHVLNIAIGRWITPTNTVQTSKRQPNPDKQLQQDFWGNRKTAALKDGSSSWLHCCNSIFMQ